MVSVTLFCLQAPNEIWAAILRFGDIFQSVVCMTREAGNNHENGLQHSESQHEHVTPSSSHNAPATIVVETSKGKSSSTQKIIILKCNIHI